MENISPTPKPKKKNFSPHKTVIIFLIVGIAASLVLAFLFYNQSKDWQRQFSEFAKEHNQLAGKVSQLSGALNQTQPQTELENQKNKENAAKKEEPKPAEPVSREAAIISAIEKANPAVASIIISKDVPKMELYYEKPFENDPFFDNFNLQIPRYRQKGTEKKQIGAGTGFLVTKDGLIITNKHVVADEEAEYAVLLSNGQQYTGKVLARDPLNDVAFVKIEG
ncbi:MAG: trypsin-like peptidase domain-containing protein, partial [bacterium]